VREREQVMWVGKRKKIRKRAENLLGRIIKELSGGSLGLS